MLHSRVISCSGFHLRTSALRIDPALHGIMPIVSDALNGVFQSLPELGVRVGELDSPSLPGTSAVSLGGNDSGGGDCGLTPNEWCEPNGMPTLLENAVTKLPKLHRASPAQ